MNTYTIFLFSLCDNPNSPGGKWMPLAKWARLFQWKCKCKRDKYINIFQRFLSCIHAAADLAVFYINVFLMRGVFLQK